ncbi:Microcin C7 self-immunity protein MccF [Microbacterium sp. 8M]|uniref:S66 family peptidase n=1 Tax=Microbacterium sp. 8M TaxID=2653153 RepID=UPI0012F18CC6|nr:S66 peptidase family protein [Microbacterium sp. 8M]VXB18344.1 Microcin C7 self-immunity protein MccF [Microbacterium sp. 8M]
MLLPPQARPGDRVAVLSPAFAAPAVSPAIHEQAMRRLAELTGLIPVEYPTTRLLDASPEQRAADVNAAFADPSIRAILATIGGSDQILVTRHLDPDLAHADPKPFLGYSDNTNILNWLWRHGVAGFYGGSTQVHLGAGPGVDEIHARSLRAALLDGGALELTEPGESEDFGPRWESRAALEAYGEREATEDWVWAGPAERISATTWGGCVEVLAQLALADRFPPPEQLDGVILLLETSERLTPAAAVAEQLRAYGERGLLGRVSGAVVARPPVSTHDVRPPAADRAALREAQRDAVLTAFARYNPGAVVCVGVPFGHTRPQWILPYGGRMTLDGTARRIVAEYA